MKIRLSLVLAVLALFVAAWGLAVVSGYASDAPGFAGRNADAVSTPAPPR